MYVARRVGLALFVVRRLQNEKHKYVFLFVFIVVAYVARPIRVVVRLASCLAARPMAIERLLGKEEAAPAAGATAAAPKRRKRKKQKKATADQRKAAKRQRGDDAPGS